MKTAEGILVTDSIISINIRELREKNPMIHLKLKRCWKKVMKNDELDRYIRICINIEKMKETQPESYVKLRECLNDIMGLGDGTW